MPGDKLTIDEKLYWEYINRTDPMDAVRAMRDEGFTVEQVRTSIDNLVGKHIEPAEANWLRAAVNMTSLSARNNPDVDDSVELARERCIDRIEAYYHSRSGEKFRENPSNTSKEGGAADRAMNAFFKSQNYKSSNISSFGNIGSRDEARYNFHTRESEYRLWDNVIAEMSRPKFGMWKLELDTSGYDTPTTFRRLENLIRIGAKYHPELASEHIHFTTANYKLVVTRNGKPWIRHPLTHMWTIQLMPIIDYSPDSALEFEDSEPYERVENEESNFVINQMKIDAIEREMTDWKYKYDKGRNLTLSELADAIGRKDEYSNLIRQRMMLGSLPEYREMFDVVKSYPKSKKIKRENPERVYWRD
jgi:hypothetical protein